MRVAVIGGGRWGQVLMRELATKCEVATCVTLGNVERRVALQQRFPAIPLSTDLAAILADPTLQAIVVATPIESHGMLARQALAAGKHVFVEKPLTNHVEDAMALADLAVKAKRVLFTGHVLLYHPAFEALLALAAADPIVSLRASWHKLGTFDSDVLWNLGSHIVALAMAFFGGAPARTEVSSRRPVVTACDVFRARLEWKDGRHCELEIDRCAPVTSRIVTCATGSGRVLSWADDMLLELGADRRYRPVAISGATAVEREIDTFLGLVADGTSAAEADFAVDVVRTLAALEQA